MLGSLPPRVSVTAMALAQYRCSACGNVTRFDVTVTRRTRAFHHFTVGGELTVEDEVVLAEHVEEVSCRWCGSGQAVEEVTEEALAEPLSKQSEA